MKIRDVITEDVDMSFWRELDSKFNPEALTYINHEEKRNKTMSELEGTPVYTKPSHKETPFTSKPKKDVVKSPGYRGLVDVHVKSGHISRDRAKKLVSPDPITSSQKSFLPHK